jgi:uncharacterized protein (TIGR04255 family)
MPFRDFPREVYQRNPLAEVVAQLRFAPILRVDAEQPAAFQDIIRGDYPNFRVMANVPGVPPGVPQPVQRMIQDLGGAGGLRQYLFASQDSQWEILLTRETLVFRTKAYGGWRDFERRFRQVREGFERVYQPLNMYRGLHLRYIDIIQRSRLGLHDEPWSNLLSAAVAAELASPEIGNAIDKMKGQIHFRLDEYESFVWLRTELVQAKDGTRETSFLIDSDFHTHKATSIQDVEATFQRFNRHSRNLFRWAIQERLRQALEPLVQG